MYIMQYLQVVFAVEDKWPLQDVKACGVRSSQQLLQAPQHITTSQTALSSKSPVLTLGSCTQVAPEVWCVSFLSTTAQQAATAADTLDQYLR